MDKPRRDPEYTRDPITCPSCISALRADPVRAHIRFPGGRVVHWASAGFYPTLCQRVPAWHMGALRPNWPWPATWDAVAAKGLTIAGSPE